MRKISVLLVSLFILITSGCADIINKEYGAETFVYTFEEMGCSGSFGDINVGRSAGVVFPTEVVTSLNCNSKTTVKIEFYDSPAYPGHYLYFVVNGYEAGYEAQFGAGEPANFTFKANPAYYSTPGSFYGNYRVTAINRENGRYTYFDYNITAFDNYGKTPAPSLGKVKPEPEFVLEDEKASNTNKHSQEQSKDKAGNNTTIDAKVLPENTSKTDEKLQ